MQRCRQSMDRRPTTRASPERLQGPAEAGRHELVREATRTWCPPSGGPRESAAKQRPGEDGRKRTAGAGRVAEPDATVELRGASRLKRVKHQIGGAVDRFGVRAHIVRIRGVDAGA